MDLNELNLSKKEMEEAKAREEKKLAIEIMQDFERRREARRSLESGWLLNMNFFSGNQYCDVSPFGGVTEEDKQFYWQSRRVFNHIAPTIDSRIAKLEKMKPELTVRAYRFTEKNAEIFSCVEKLKTERLAVMEEGYLMQRLIRDYALTQDDVALLIGKSRPAVANTLRLLTLAPEVVGLIESGRLSAGHARTLVKVPHPQQFAFAEEAIKRGYSVREMERAVKAFLTPPEVLQKEKEAKAVAKGEELKAFVERMRSVFRTKVSLIGNDKKGRIYIDYYSAEDLYRFEELLDMIESYDRD